MNVSDRFCHTLQPLIDALAEDHARGAAAFRFKMPEVIWAYFRTRHRDPKVALGWLLAYCLICSGRIPTAAWIYRLMHDECFVSRARDPELIDLKR